MSAPGRLEMERALGVVRMGSEQRARFVAEDDDADYIELRRMPDGSFELRTGERGLVICPQARNVLTVEVEARPGERMPRSGSAVKSC